MRSDRRPPGDRAGGARLQVAGGDDRSASARGVAPGGGSRRGGGQRRASGERARGGARRNRGGGARLSRPRGRGGAHLGGGGPRPPLEQRAPTRTPHRQPPN